MAGGPRANPTPFSIGGSVTGLRGTGLVLENNGGDPLSVSANGSFTFATQVLSGAPYSVAVRTQPTASPQEMCSITNGSGTVPSGPVTNVSVACHAATGKYLYVLTTTDPFPTNLIHAFRINPDTGALSFIPGSPFPDKNDGYEANVFRVDPMGRFLFAVGSTFLRGVPNSLSGYAIDSATGALSPIPGVLRRGSLRMELHPNGKVLYLRGEGVIAAHSIHPTTGALTPVPGSPFGLGDYRYSVGSGTLNAAGTMTVEASLRTGAPTHINTLAVDAATGALTLMGTTDLPSEGSGVFVLHPEGRYAYMLRSGSVVLVSIEDPFNLVAVELPVDGTNNGFLFERSGRYAYKLYYDPVSNAGAVVGYRVEPGGALTSLPGSPYATNGTTFYSTENLTFDPSHRFVVATTGSSSIAVLRIDPATGELAHAAGSPFIPTVGTTPGPVLFDPSGRFAYVIDYDSSSISAYSFDSQSGKFTFISSYAVSAMGRNYSFPRIAGLQ